MLEKCQILLKWLTSNSKFVNNRHYRSLRYGWLIYHPPWRPWKGRGWTKALKRFLKRHLIFLLELSAHHFYLISSYQEFSLEFSSVNILCFHEAHQLWYLFTSKNFPDWGMNMGRPYKHWQERFVYKQWKWNPHNDLTRRWLMHFSPSMNKWSS